MSEVRGPLAEMSEHGRLDGLHSFRLLGMVGYPVFRAVGVRHKQRPFAVVAASGAHRFAFFLPNRAPASSAPCSGVLTILRCAAASGGPGAPFHALFTRWCAVVGLWGANRAPPQLAVCRALRHDERQSCVFRTCNGCSTFVWRPLFSCVCGVGSALTGAMAVPLALPLTRPSCRAHAKRPGTTPSKLVL